MHANKMVGRTTHFACILKTDRGAPAREPVCFGLLLRLKDVKAVQQLAQAFMDMAHTQLRNELYALDIAAAEVAETTETTEEAAEETKKTL
jgi:hypothetical protein